MHGDIKDIGILTVIPAELTAARETLGIRITDRIKDADGTIFYHGTIRSTLKSCDYSIVLSCIGMAGNTDSAAATSEMIQKYNPRAIILVGIAAGIKGKVRIGEVVLSDRVVAYEPAAVIEGSNNTMEEQPRPEIDRLPHTMEQNLTAYLADIDPTRLTEAFIDTGWNFPEPSSRNKLLYQRHVASQIMTRNGTIASGEKLLRNPEKLTQIRKIHGKTEVGEMEAAGFVKACRRRHPIVPWLVVRGISDFGDSWKDDRFHDLAARAAATVIADFLRFGLDFGGPSARTPIQDVQSAIADSLKLARLLMEQFSNNQPMYTDEIMRARQDVKNLCNRIENWTREISSESNQLSDENYRHFLRLIPYIESNIADVKNRIENFSDRDRDSRSEISRRIGLIVARMNEAQTIIMKL